MHSALLLAIAALPFLGADALKCSTTARCGTQSGNKLTCKNSVFGNCCSRSGYCGSGPLYCGTGCQVGFGDCKSSGPSSVRVSSTTVKASTTSAKASSTSIGLSTSSATVVVVESVETTKASSTAEVVSTTEILDTVTTSPVVPVTPESSSTPSASAPVASDPSATPSSALATPDSSSTPSASAPVTTESPSTPSSSALATSETPSAPSSSAPAASSSSTPDVKVSTDATCGGANGFTCLGSAFGDCCSEYGWCGSTSIYCDAGCNPAFGNCNTASSSVEPTPSSTPSSTLAPTSFITSTRTSSAEPTPTQGVSADGQCGATNGLTCQGSVFGNCCSQYNYCGSDPAFCGTGCQSPFGSCTPPPAPGLTCNVEGFANTPYYASSFNLVDATDISTCAALCLAEAECNSYLFNPGLGNCAYLKQSLAEGEFLASPGTNQFFWDRECATA